MKLILAIIALLAIAAIFTMQRGRQSQTQAPQQQQVDNGVRCDFSGAVGNDKVPSGWQARAIIGDTDFAVESGPMSESVLHLRSTRAHYLLYDEIQPIDAEQYHSMAWTWKAMTLPTNGDCRTHAALPLIGDNRNDEGLQVLVGFEGKYVINYVWDATAPVGTEVPEFCPVATLKTIVVESGSDHLNSWVDEHVNFYDDFQRLYGMKPGKILGVAVMTNSNHTGTASDGFIGPIFLRHS